jgi:hypothetical protein
VTKTLQDRFLLALQARGETEVKRLTGCIVVTRSKDGGDYYYLGKGGSLRFGKTRAGSYACGQRFRDLLLASLKEA